MDLDLDLDLPPLSDKPTRYPDFCLSLSTHLIQALSNIFNNAALKSRSNLILSVGSGSGLLEAHLLSFSSSIPSCKLLVHGVEVQTPDDARPVNRYLPEQICSTVRGTSQLSTDLQSACALLFVYPRDPELVLRYFKAAHDQVDSPLQAVVWLGPRADYDVFAGCLQSALDDRLGDTFCPVEIEEVRGMAEYEMMAVVRRSATRHATTS